MFQKGLSQSTRKNLELLAKLPKIKNFYLAGGSACALHLGHRLSFDLDFFTKKTFDSKALVEVIKKQGIFSIEQRLPDTLLGNLNGEKVSFFYYKYPLLKPLNRWRGIFIASLQDIAAMKLEAISGRGRKRDFIDLYCMRKQISLEQVLKVYDKKYKVLANNLRHLLKSLAYFADAEMDEMPKMLIPVSWEEIKDLFIKEVLRLSRKFLR